MYTCVSHATTRWVKLLGRGGGITTGAGGGSAGGGSVGGGSVGGVLTSHAVADCESSDTCRQTGQDESDHRLKHSQ